MADYITTYTKVHITPLEPKAEDIRIEDIAHALSLMTRANGHFPEFYSVGQHCIACYEEASARGYSKRVRLACLLHDAAEAYLSDVTRPIKKSMDYFVEAENQLLHLIYKVFLGHDITEEEAKLIENVDDTLLYHEFFHYMGEKLHDPGTPLVSKPVFAVRPFAEVEKEYLDIFHTGMQRIKNEERETVRINGD